MNATLTEPTSMAPAKKTNLTRDRVEFKAPPAWIVRVMKHAQRKGINSISAYIRMVVTEAMDREEQEYRPASKPPRD